MKYRLTALVVFLSLLLASCSLAEDITPPPGYQPAAALPTQIPGTPTQEPTALPVTAQATPLATNSTEQPGTQSATQQATAALTQSSTTPAGITGTPGAVSGTVSGKLTNGSGSTIPAGQKVTLEEYDQDQSGSYQITNQLESTVNADGSYNYPGVEILPNRAFLIITGWQGIEYQSDPVIVKDTSTSIYSIPLIIYDKTEDLKSLTFSQVHLSFVLSAQNNLDISEIFIVSNPGKQAVIVSSTGTTIPFITIPVVATNVQYQLSQNSAPLMNATNGFAMEPGADKQYVFVASYSMSYKDPLKFDQPFSLPVNSVTVFLPQGLSLSGNNLTSAGTQAVQGQTFSMFQTNNLASGSSLSFTLSGKPATGTSTGTDKTWLWIGIAVVGILLIGVGTFLYLRDRKRSTKSEAPEVVAVETEDDPLGDDSDTIIDAMIALDDKFKSGEIPREAYEKRRLELKERLKAIL